MTSARNTGKSLELFTIGAYGWKAEPFFEALRSRGIDTFCDIRARRGVRGSEFAFANSNRLQAELARLGIRYLHFPELAPDAELRKEQGRVDEAAGIAKRKRSELSPDFVAGYRESRLAKFDSHEFAARLPADSQRVVLFCVERVPQACHRSLLAERLVQDLGIPLTHLIP